MPVKVKENKAPIQTNDLQSLSLFSLGLVPYFVLLAQEVLHFLITQLIAGCSCRPRNKIVLSIITHVIHIMKCLGKRIHYVDICKLLK